MRERHTQTDRHTRRQTDRGKNESRNTYEIRTQYGS